MNAMAAAELFGQVANRQKRRTANLVGSTNFARLRWLVKFVNEPDFDRMSTSKFERCTRQVIAFANLVASSFEVEANRMSRQGVGRIAASARNGMHAFAGGASWDLPQLKLSPSLIPGSERLAINGSWEDAFFLSVGTLLLGCSGILRVCAARDCKTLFAKRKRKIFCSPRCSDRERMRRFQADRKRYKAKRREYYLNSLKGREANESL
jgi:hypothetical protein